MYQGSAEINKINWQATLQKTDRLDLLKNPGINWKLQFSWLTFWILFSSDASPDTLLESGVAPPFSTCGVPFLSSPLVFSCSGRGRKNFHLQAWMSLRSWVSERWGLDWVVRVCVCVDGEVRHNSVSGGIKHVRVQMPEGTVQIWRGAIQNNPDGIQQCF